ncbi:MAG: cation transporter, partial [Pirellulales bacterium]|nr:cation transporter [Pirellulales bacterium]
DLVERNSLETGKWANLAMAIAGVTAAYASHSDAILVDGLYSGVNFVSAIIAARITASVIRPPNRAYPFGYDAYEALYVKYRSMILIGIMTFAIFGAVSKIITYATGGDVPELVFGPIVFYMLAMVVTCFSLAAWHRHNWKKTGSRSELLQTESRAADGDGVIRDGPGGGLLAAALLRGTSLEFIVPVSDSIVVLLMSLAILPQPLKMFLGSLREVAGEAARGEIADRVTARTREVLASRDAKIMDVAVMKMGRNFIVIVYLNPSDPYSANDVDVIRHELLAAFKEIIGDAKVEIILTAEDPYIGDAKM